MLSIIGRARRVRATVSELLDLQRELAIPPDALVLDVGSGHNPNPRANVLCDLCTGAVVDRHGFPAVVDRPFVVGDAEELPFRDKAFDFVICSHLIEHVSDPVRVASELSRVGHAGYIEAPSEVFERTYGFLFHRWFVRVEEGELVLTPKTTPLHDPVIREWFPRVLEALGVSDRFWRERARLGVLVKLRWKGSVPIRVTAPVLLPRSQRANEKPAPSSSPQRRLFDRIRHVWSRSLRRRSDRRLADLALLLRCPCCSGSITLDTQGETARCDSCGALYPYRGGVPILVKDAARFSSGG